ncbi:MAG: hypothetical protein ACRDSP_26040 [Pseudonocardiaceae bacterium]
MFCAQLGSQCFGVWPHLLADEHRDLICGHIVDRDPGVDAVCERTGFRGAVAVALDLGGWGRIKYAVGQLLRYHAPAGARSPAP